jgi:hypothetical protein
MVPSIFCCISTCKHFRQDGGQLFQKPSNFLNTIYWKRCCFAGYDVSYFFCVIYFLWVAVGICRIRAYSYIHTYHSSFIPVGEQRHLRSTETPTLYQNDLAMRQDKHDRMISRSHSNCSPSQVWGILSLPFTTSMEEVYSTYSSSSSCPYPNMWGRYNMFFIMLW